MENQIRDSLNKVCGVLNGHGVEYIVIGGVAIGFHGYPRATADIDLWYKPSTTNFHRIIDALRTMHVETDALEKIVFDPKKTFLRIPIEGYQIEFLPRIPGVKSFEGSARDAIKADLDGVTVKVLSLRDMIRNKESLNRPIDRSDLDELRKRNPAQND